MLLTECLEEFQALMMQLRRALIRPTQLRGVPKMVQRPADGIGVGILPLLYRATLRQQRSGPRPIFIQNRDLGQRVQRIGDTASVAQFAKECEALGKPRPGGGAVTLLPRQMSQASQRRGIPPSVAYLARKLYCLLILDPRGRVISRTRE